MRLRLFYREPGAMFWTFGFPLVLTIVLGVAFRNRGPEPIFVAVEAPAEAPIARAERAHAILSAGDAVVASRMSPPEAAVALRTGRVSLVVVPTADGYAYRFDPSRPESRVARAVSDDLLQRGEGRTDPFTPALQRVSEPGSRYVDFLVPGLIGLGLMGTGLWGIGFSLTEMRTKKLLKRMMATPMRRTEFLLSFLLVRALLMFAELPPLLLFARLAFDVKIAGSIAALAVIAMVGGLTFGVMGLLIASRTENMQVVTGLINVVSFPMYLCSGVFFSSSRFPDAIQPLLRVLPLTAFIDALRAVMIDGASLGSQLGRVAICGAWGVGCFAVALRLFKWR
ncbi:MAG: ABC transporter permease [Labilithrix sp.]|nr:ABC transporter permease [Labilithrix sp.]